MKEKILVTGGAGFIGSHVADHFIQSGHPVVIVDNLSSGRRENINPQAAFYQVDIGSPEMRSIFEHERPQVISHHAAQIDVRHSVSNPIFDATTNILGSIHLAQLAVEFKVRKFIHISSGGAAYGEPAYLPCDEKHPVQPLSPYGASKYAFELYPYIFKHNFGLDYTILRYANVYGPRQDPHGEAGVVAIFTSRMLRQEPVTIFGSGEQVRDFVFVSDCGRANLLALEQGSGKAYNIGCGVGTTINQIFDHLRSITTYPLPANYGPAKPGETFRIYLDADLASQELGWTPQLDLEAGLRQTVEYFRKTRE